MTAESFVNGKKLGKTFVFTALALLAFAANSVLCRLALANGAIDAASFTGIRLLSGIVVLLVILKTGAHTQGSTQAKGSWQASLMLLIYAVAFSYAYISLNTATGALILFGAVQMTMILLALASGEQLQGREWIGLLTAFCGFITLVLPGVTAPSVSGFLLMAVAGIAWGVYTLNGRQSRAPLRDTTWNFVRTLPFVAVLALVAMQQGFVTPTGFWLAAISGGIASGIGYTIWYKALRGLSATQAAVVQLLVPVIAALGGIVFIEESFTLRLTLASLMILGGIAMTIIDKNGKSNLRY